MSNIIATAYMWLLSPWKSSQWGWGAPLYIIFHLNSHMCPAATMLDTASLWGLNELAPSSSLTSSPVRCCPHPSTPATLTSHCLFLQNTRLSLPQGSVPSAWRGLPWMSAWLAPCLLQLLHLQYSFPHPHSFPSSLPYSTISSSRCFSPSNRLPNSLTS